jgi:hypothetical protein
MILIINYFALDHDVREKKINMTWKCQIEDLEGVFFQTNVLQIPRVCKNSITNANALHKQFSMLHHKISRNLMFLKQNGDQEKFDNP